MHENGSYGPCCCNYMRVPAPPFPDGADLDRLWNSGVFRTFRKAMLAGERPRTCRDTCPALAGGTDRLDRMTIKGGPAALVENQIRCIRAMIEGRVEVAHAPTRVNVAATTFCNYDCLMCDCGRKGTLKDQRTPEFYRKLKPWIGGAELIEASGGEPLASPNYRKFVAGMAASDLPANLLVTTNGSLLTPAWLATLPRIPFALICISLNAATAGTYLAVNRGATWKTIRRNIDELLRLRRGGRFNGAILYSMVILRRNLHEIRAFAEMAVRDGVNVRYHLPNRDLNGQTIMTDEGSMIRAADALEEAAGLLDAHAMTWSADEVRSRLTVLRNRLAAGIFEPI
jgi:molybdenum cofactor biosynthesis enzyme MoaA